MNIENGINNDIRFLAQSEIRLKILSELNEEPDNIGGLVKKTRITYSSVASNVSKLEKNNYIERIKNKYYISPMTEIIFKSIMDFKSSVDLINNFDSFWDKHNLDQISIDSVKSITDLKNSKLIETTPLDIYKTHNTTKNQLMKSTSVKAIFPYLHPDYPRLIEKILKNNGTVELIIPRSIYQVIMSNIDNTVRRTAYRNKRLIAYPIKEDLQLYLTICDESMCLGLFKNDGSFDQNRILTSFDENAQKWAENLFDNIKHEVIK